MESKEPASSTGERTRKASQDIGWPKQTDLGAVCVCVCVCVCPERRKPLLPYLPSILNLDGKMAFLF